MSKLSIILTKREVEQAVLNYVNKGITVNGRKEINTPEVSFMNAAGDIGYFTCSIDTDDFGIEKGVPDAKQ